MDKSEIPTAQGNEGRSRDPRSRNFLVLALYHITLRIGWIFKTESVIMPAVLDAIGYSQLRGFLPLLNRLGQSFPPLLYADRLREAPKKKWQVAFFTLGMAISFLVLAAVYFYGDLFSDWTKAVTFLVMYTIFFVFTGLDQLAIGTLQGKTVRPTRRGRLMAVSTVAGALLAAGAAWFLLRPQLDETGGNFSIIFAICGIWFAITAVTIVFVKESPDSYPQAKRGTLRQFALSWEIVRTDTNFRRLTIVAVLYGFSMCLFPHYQAMGRESLQLSYRDLVLWAIVQNTGAALFSILAGPLADNRGNRLALRAVLLVSAGLPVLALCLVNISGGEYLYPLLFFMLGITPVAFRIFMNYTLETVPPEKHPRYLVTLNMAWLVPLLASPAIGYLIIEFGYSLVFIITAIVVFVGWLVTFGLKEPRHDHVPTSSIIATESIENTQILTEEIES